MSKWKTTAIVMARIVVFLLCVYSIVWITCLLLNWGGKCPVSYYATFENGDTVKVDNIIAVPISSVEQVSKMWPEYYAETTINIDGKEIILRSKPFLFCDNPEMEGKYAGRDVYYSLAGRK